MSRTRLENFVPPIEMDEITDFEEYEIQQRFNRRPDLYAQEKYNNKSLWWIFAYFNRDEIKDPLYDFTAGKTIKVPTARSVIGL